MVSAVLIKPHVSSADKLLEIATSKTWAKYVTGYQGDAGKGLWDVSTQMQWDEVSFQSVCIIRVTAPLPTVQEIMEWMNIHVGNIFHNIELNYS